MIYRAVRILITLIFARLSERSPPTAPMTMRVSVWPSDADLKNAHQASILFLFELGRWDSMMRAGVLGVLAKRRVAPILAGQHVRYLRPLRRFHRYDLMTQMVFWDERMWFVEHRLEREGKVHARGLVRGIFRERSGDVPIAELLRIAGADGVPPPEPEAVAHWRLLDQALAPSA